MPGPNAILLDKPRERARAGILGVMNELDASQLDELYHCAVVIQADRQARGRLMQLVDSILHEWRKLQNV